MHDEPNRREPVVEQARLMWRQQKATARRVAKARPGLNRVRQATEPRYDR